MTKIAVVGDLHGRFEVVEELLEWDHDIVFIGDYLDSFDRAAVEQLRTLDLVLEAVKSGKAKALLGNHEMAYMDRKMACSGNTIEVQLGLLERDMSILLTHLWIGEDILLSHAGVSQALLDDRKQTLTEYLDFGEFNQIGRSRRGPDFVGGLYWCDWWKEFKPIDNIRQVVGHSAYRPTHADSGIVIMSDSYGSENYNIDCLDRVNQVLVIDDGVISIEGF
jgi:Calcineurin-like phosphoesterase.